MSLFPRSVHLACPIECHDLTVAFNVNERYTKKTIQQPTLGNNVSVPKWNTENCPENPYQKIAKARLLILRAGHCSGALRLMVKVREVMAMIEIDGWRRVRAKGGHRQYKHPLKKGRVTVSGHPSDDVHPKTLSSVLRQAGLK